MVKISRNIIVFIALFLVLNLTACGQKSIPKSECDSVLPYLAHLDNLRPLVEEKYGFISIDSNILHFDTASASMRFLLDKWLRVVAEGQESLNIVQIGSSHVQAGVFPHRIRCNILQAYPDRVGERGYIFPYSAAAKCNNPYDYKVHCKESVALTRCVYKEPEVALGVGGIAVTFHDSLSTVQVVNNERRFDFHTRQVVPIGEWVCDSAHFGACPDAPEVSLTKDSFEVRFPCDSVWSYNLRGFFLKGSSQGFTYHSIGVNGAALSDYCRCPFFCRDLKLLSPDLVIFGIGINDASGPNFDTAVFRQNYLRLIDSIRTVNPHCAFIFITNNDSFRKVRRNRYEVNKNGLLAREVFYRLAQETGGAVWDQFEVMGGLKSMDKWRLAKLAKADRVHFTREGYELLGDLLSQALLRVLYDDAKKHIDNASKKTKTTSANINIKQSFTPIPQY